MADRILSLAEIGEVERAYALGAASLGVGARELLARWRLPLRDDETFLRLAFLVWYQQNEPVWLTGLDQPLPPVRSLLDERGGDETLTPEARFTLAFLWRFQPPVEADEDACRATAVRWGERAAAEEPTSDVFRDWRYFLWLESETRGPRIYIERELHARYAGRGALGDYLLHMLGTRVRPDASGGAAG